MDIVSFIKGFYVGKKVSDINHDKTLLNERKIINKCRAIELISTATCVCAAACLLYSYDSNKIVSQIKNDINSTKQKSSYNGTQQNKSENGG